MFAWKDFLGNELKKQDFIIYVSPKRDANCSKLRRAIVVEVDNLGVKVERIPTNEELATLNNFQKVVRLPRTDNCINITALKDTVF